MKDKILNFPKKKKGLSAEDCDTIRFLTRDGRYIWTQDPDDIKKIIQFIAVNKITLCIDIE